MSTNYPGAKDTFSTKQDNNGVKIAAADVNNLQDAVDALEQTVGYGATQPTATPTADAIAKWDSNKSLSAAAFIPQGLTGATAASRYVGATTSGAPTTGTFVVGDFAIDQTGRIWMCTVAGTPGTWVQPGSVNPAWTAPTLQNGWTNQGGGNATAGYLKDAIGFVHIKGMITGGTHSGITPIFTLPVGFRPKEVHFIATGCYNGTTDVYADLAIKSDGTVNTGTVPANNTLYLDCSFLAEQ